MRIRSIKPEFWSSEDVAAIPDYFDRLLFIGLWSYVDDNAVGRDNEKLIYAKLFPLDDPLDVVPRIQRGLKSLAAQHLIIRYTSPEGKPLLMVTGWHHQKIDKPTRSPLPRFEEPSAGTIEQERNFPEPSAENFEQEQSFVESSANPREPSRASSEGSPPGYRTRDQGIKGSRDQGILDQTQHAQARVRVKDNQPPMIAEVLSPRRYPSAFEQFWRIYPHLESQPSAFTEWGRAIRRHPVQSILAAAQRYADDPNRKPERTKAPATWLRNDCWNDAPCRPDHVTSVGPLKPDLRAMQAVESGRRLQAMHDARNGNPPPPPRREITA